MTTTDSGQYDADSILLLTGLDPIRKRPSMYTDTSSPNHLVQEVIDNSIDEALSGYAKKIQVTLFEDDSVEVIDDGRGMPVDLHSEHGISGVELIFTRLHSGGKFSDKNYIYSGGLHGVGISVVNALSSKLEVSVCRHGKTYKMSFTNGETDSELLAVGAVGVRNTGTTIRFWPDAAYFDTPQIVLPRLMALLQAKAVLCQKLAIKLRWYKQNQWQQQSWFCDTGLEGYLKTLLGERRLLLSQPFFYQLSTDVNEVQWAVQWQLDSEQPVTESYVNLIPTSYGGTHVNGLRSGLFEALCEFLEFQNLMPKGVKLIPDDFWKPCCYVLAVRMKEPQFRGQTKDKLVSRQATALVMGAAKDSFSLWLNQHTSEARQLAELTIARAQNRIKSAQKTARKKITSGPALPGKLADCSSQDVNTTEIFLVEGDSAGGSAKQARNREYQAILPLRGKIMNSWEVDSAVALQFQEINNIAVALGVSPGEEDLSGLRYGKVCILADADPDGLHIATLLCALFLRHFRSLIEKGHVYVAMSPLYRINVSQEVFYALDDADKENILQQIAAANKKGKVNVQRFKGLGEMNPLQLRETAMAPATRRLVKLTVNDDESPDADMDMMMAKKRSADRRAWLESDRPELAPV